MWDSGNCLPTSSSVNPSLCPKWEAYNDPKFLLSSFLSINQTVTGILACVQTTLPSGKIGFFLKGGGICTQATGIWGFKGKWADILNAQDFFDIRELTGRALNVHIIISTCILFPFLKCRKYQNLPYFSRSVPPGAWNNYLCFSSATFQQRDTRRKKKTTRWRGAQHSPSREGSGLYRRWRNGPRHKDQ